MPLCTAKSKSTGRQCGNLAIKGADVCRSHGGAAPQVKAKAAERQIEAKARVELGKLDALIGPAEPVENPLDELLQLAGEAKRWKDLIEARVSGLTAVGYQGVTGEQVKAEVTLMERAIDRLGGLLATIARLNIDERLARVNEQQAETVLKVVDAVVAYAQLTGEEAGVAKRLAVAILTGNIPPKVAPAASRVVEVQVPVPTTPPPRLERQMIEAPKPAAADPFLLGEPSESNHLSGDVADSPIPSPAGDSPFGGPWAPGRDPGAGGGGRGRSRAVSGGPTAGMSVDAVCGLPVVARDRGAVRCSASDRYRSCRAGGPQSEECPRPGVWVLRDRFGGSTARGAGETGKTPRGSSPRATRSPRCTTPTPRGANSNET